MVSKPSPCPKNWPKEILYLSSYLPLSTVDKKDAVILRSSCSSPLLKPSLVRIQSISDPAHPANGQRGLFAAASIKAGTWLCDYIGEVSLVGTESTTSDYTLRLGSRFVVDAARAGNECRFVNDYRGISRLPNVAFIEYDHCDKFPPKQSASRGGVAPTPAPRSALCCPRMAVVAKVDIKKGSELLVSYGKGFWAGREVDLGEQYVAQYYSDARDVAEGDCDGAQ